MSERKCSCCCGVPVSSREYRIGVSGGMKEREVSLSRLSPGECGEILSLSLVGRSRGKLADVGLIPGICVKMEAHAPFGSLCRIGLLGTSLAISMQDASQIHVRLAGCQEGGEA